MTDPILRWPGGKRKLLPELLDRIPDSFGCFHEPFVGGGAMTFALQPTGGFISDLNGELINFYTVLKQKPRELIEYLQRFPVSKKDYYRIRNEDRNPMFTAVCPIYRAARYLFINRTCFNGLMSVNRQGQISVSSGTPLKESRVYATESIWQAHEALRAIRIYSDSYVRLLDVVRPGDFVYLDPPYVPVKPSGDIKYTKEGFSITDQAKLAILCEELTKLGVHWMLSNANVDFIKTLYGQYKIEEIEARRSISGWKQARGKIKELVVMNY